MNGVEIALVMGLAIAFIGGVLIAVVVLVSVASRREDRLFTLTGEAPDAMCRGARKLFGVGTRGGWPSEPVSRRRLGARSRDVRPSGPSGR